MDLLICLPLPQFYRDYDRALNNYMSVDNGIGMDLTLVSPSKARALPCRLWAGWSLVALHTHCLQTAATAPVLQTSSLHVSVQRPLLINVSTAPTGLTQLCLFHHMLCTTRCLGSLQDLTPPKDSNIRVMVLRDHGSIALSHSACVPLVKGSVHNLKCSEAEHLVRMGVLQVLDPNC